MLLFFFFYWMQRTIHCVGFVVEWFIGTQWPAFGFGKRWTAWLCLSVCVSLLLTVCFFGAPYLFLLYLPFPTLLHLLKFFPFLFPFLHLRFSLFLHVSESPSYHRYITSVSLSFFPVSEYPPRPFSTLPRNSGLRGGSLSIYSRVLFEEALSFPCLSVGAWQDEQHWAWPLGLVCGFCGSMRTMKCCSRAYANCIAAFIKSCQWVSNVLKCFTWSALMIPKE